MIDLNIPDDDTETIVVASGGGSRGLWQWLVLLMVASRFKVSMICGTSAGALNAYGFGKGLIDYVSATYREVFANNAAPITGPGLAEIKNGKLAPNMDAIEASLLKGISMSDVLRGVNIWDVWKLIGKKSKGKLVRQILDENIKPLLRQILNNFLSAPTLLDNAPLYDRIREMQKLNPGWRMPTYWNRVNMRNGQLEEDGWDSGFTPEQEVKSAVASTTIPLLWPLVDGIYGDGGLREGTPLAQIFNRLDPAKKYRIIMIECSRDEMPEDTSLDNPLHIAMQTVAIQMNESRRNDVRGVWDKNQEAKDKGEALGRRYVPMYRIRYSGMKSSLDFSSEAAEDFRQRAHADYEDFIKLYDAV